MSKEKFTWNEINDLYLRRYYNSAERPDIWFASGEMNQKIAEHFLKLYDSYNRRELLQAEESSTQVEESVTADSNQPKKRRIKARWHGELSPYILMFFGLSLECLLKGLLIKQGKIEPLNKAKRHSLSEDITKHKLECMYKRAFIGEIIEKAHCETLERCERAILAGKYRLEKSKNFAGNSYTGYFKEDIPIVRNMIKKIRGL